MKLEEYLIGLPMFIKDRPECNKLIEGTEFTPEEIKMALIMALEKFNTTPPLVLTYSLEQFPIVSMLMLGATARLMDMAVIAKNRNRLPYSDAGLSVDDDGQAPQYQQVKQIMMQEFEEWMRNYKKAINVEQCYGGISSEYSITYPYNFR